MKKKLCDLVFDNASKEMRLFLEKLLKKGEVYLFGGAVRDYLLEKTWNPRDLDLVLDFYEQTKIEDYIPDEIIIGENKFGGLFIVFNQPTLIVDIWKIQNTWAFKQKILKTSPENLLKSVFLNIDSLLYCLNDNVFVENCDKRIFDIINSKIIDIELKENPRIATNIVRAINFKKKYNMNFSRELNVFFREFLNSNEFSQRKMEDIFNIGSILK